MKTLVRISNFKENGYNMKVVQVLNKKYRDSDILEEVGFIKFQQTVGEDKWYGLRFEVSTDDPTKIQKMANLAKYIRGNTNWDSQPEEVLSAIGAVFYNHIDKFVPVSKDGENIYDVIVKSGSLHSRIVAPNEIVANKILKKRNIDGEIKFNCKLIC